MATEVNKPQNVEVSQKVVMPSINNGKTTTANPQIGVQEKMLALKHMLYEDLTGCDAKWTLFVSAAQSYRFLTQLEPFPPQFIMNEKLPNGLNINGLVRTINETPRLHTLLIFLKDSKPQDINLAVLDLVYWVLVTNQYPQLRTLTLKDFLEAMPTLGTDMPKIEDPIQAYMLVYPKDSSAELEFKKASESLPTAFAYYGNQLDTIYSLLNNGFKNYHNPKNNFVGKTLELYPTLGGCVHKSPASAAWGFSSCGSILSCIAVCEYIDNPHFIKLKTNEDTEGVKHCEKIYISNTDLVRIRYLLLYGNRTTDDVVDAAKKDEKEKNWFARNKNILSVTLSLVLAITILKSTKRGGSVASFCTQNIGQALALCSSTLKLDFLNKFK